MLGGAGVGEGEGAEEEGGGAAGGDTGVAVVDGVTTIVIVKRDIPVLRVGVVAMNEEMGPLRDKTIVGKRQVLR